MTQLVSNVFGAIIYTLFVYIIGGLTAPILWNWLQGVLKKHF